MQAATREVLETLVEWAVRQGGGGGQGEVCFKAIFGVVDGDEPCQETGLQQSLKA